MKISGAQVNPCGVSEGAVPEMYRADTIIDSRGLDAHEISRIAIGTMRLVRMQLGPS